MSQITVQDAYDRRDEVQFLDVREPMEWVAGHIEGAIHIPMAQLRDDREVLAKDRTIVCVCRSGHRSAAVTVALTRAGLDAVNLVGGMQEWAGLKLPFVAEGDQDPYVA
ncbi:MAG: rhodanese-related sulfurtransferase [Nitriliruptoraceae bacterium]|jgi:rhodanese-related sulfurtransferase